MGVNTKVLPLKLHYFFFLGGVSPILPFVMVIGTDLGLPVSTTGALSAASLVVVIFVKPIISALADAFPTHRRLLFILTLAVMVVSLSSIAFVPPMGEKIMLEGQLLASGMDHQGQGGEVTTPKSEVFVRFETQQQHPVAVDPLLLIQDGGKCPVKVGWSCMVINSTDPKRPPRIFGANHLILINSMEREGGEIVERQSKELEIQKESVEEVRIRGNIVGANREMESRKDGGERWDTLGVNNIEGEIIDEGKERGILVVANRQRTTTDEDKERGNKLEKIIPNTSTTGVEISMELGNRIENNGDATQTMGNSIKTMRQSEIRTSGEIPNINTMDEETKGGMYTEAREYLATEEEKVGIYAKTGEYSANSYKGRPLLYRLKGTNITSDLLDSNVSIECGVSQSESHVGCQRGSSWRYPQFWSYLALLLTGTSAYKTAVSVTDAIVVDIIGPKGDYGTQRAWGTVGWGVMGPVSGVLIDWWSGYSSYKNYAPAYILCFILGSIDVLVASTAIKVPKIRKEKGQLRKVLPLLCQPQFLVFCVFVILNGAFNMLAISLVFVMQRDMAEGMWYMDHIKLIQGLTVFVQCGTEAPFMMVNRWFLKRLGPHQLTTLVFFLYSVRLFGLGWAGWSGVVWWTLVVEMLNGPCYGLGYTAIVTYSATISPSGTSTTTQGLVNICYESFGYALGMFGGGLVYGGLGGPWMFVVGGVTALGTLILHLLSLHLLPPPLPKEEREEPWSEGQDQEAEKEIQQEEEQPAIYMEEGKGREEAKKLVVNPGATRKQL